MKCFNRNGCDGIYNSFDIHFTSACDNRCSHCVDKRYGGLSINKPNVTEIVKTVIENSKGYDDVLFLGGEPCLYLDELIECVTEIKKYTSLKVFVTTSVPKICYDEREKFEKLLSLLDGINLSVQHYDENVADAIRKSTSKFDRQEFYKSLPYKNKIRINLNIVKPHLYTSTHIITNLRHYDKRGFNEIKLSEIQHGEKYFVSFEKIFRIKLGSPFFSGCQTYLNMNKIIPLLKTPVILKRSCFICEETLRASFMDGVKCLYRLFVKSKNKYGVVYENGELKKSWI